MKKFLQKKKKVQILNIIPRDNHIEIVPVVECRLKI